MRWGFWKTVGALRQSVVLAFWKTGKKCVAAEEERVLASLTSRRYYHQKRPLLEAKKTLKKPFNPNPPGRPEQFKGHYFPALFRLKLQADGEFISRSTVQSYLPAKAVAVARMPESQLKAMIS